jgi:hypothetical protein
MSSMMTPANLQSIKELIAATVQATMPMQIPVAMDTSGA